MLVAQYDVGGAEVDGWVEWNVYSANSATAWCKGCTPLKSFSVGMISNEKRAKEEILEIVPMNTRSVVETKVCLARPS